MIFCDFHTTTHGKWILAGEHAVLRGHPALVFPVLDKKLTLTYHSTEYAVDASYAGTLGAEIMPLFWRVLEHGLDRQQLSMADIRGHFELRSTIPIGMGMGASAALCVALSRWFAAQHLITEYEPHHFAKELEHLFHGQSSGVDIAGVAAVSGSHFQQGISRPIKQAWAPQWYLSTCNEAGMTSPCIQTVQALWKTNSLHAATIDEQMHASVTQAKIALEGALPHSQSLLAAAIRSAANCFEQWGLVSPSLQQHIDALYDAGALAVKPTGSGGGGYVVSLWEGAPAQKELFDLMPI